ncbi:MAG: DUF423 domain-containing protein [Gammaproteobacteria bacterium]|nr:DUF423 domain-containing protein [Gammaproteobacteria bacterium]MCW8923820.1 DUF423 domain-containing protein [Gammaproteobacteria bacterium]
MSNLFIGLGALNAFFAVAMGAFAAHKLKASLSAYYLSIVQTAADYQMYHALGLILIGLLYQHNKTRLTVVSGWLLFTGIILFSGSLYTLGLTGTKWLGMVTPVGGFCFLIAWLMLAFSYLKPTKT